MKKFLLVLSLAGCLFAAAPVQAAGTGTDSEIADKLLLYIPNRLVDALDMFTVNLGIGPVIEALWIDFIQDLILLSRLIKVLYRLLTSMDALIVVLRCDLKNAKQRS